MLPAVSVRTFMGFGILFLAACITSLLLFQPYVLIVPFAALLFFWACHNPFVLFYVLVAAIPWSIEHNFTPSLGTDLPTEPLMLLTSFGLLSFLVYHAHKRPLRGFFSSPLTIVLLLQALWWGVSTYFSTDYAVSVKYCLAKGWYLSAFVLTPYVLFQHRKQMIRVAQIFSISMLLLVARTIVKHYEFGFTFERINDSLWPHFRNHVNYSAVLACVLPLLIAGYKFAESKKRKQLFAVLLGISALALFLSYARGAWLAMIVGAAAFWLMRFRGLVHGFLLGLVLTAMATFALIDDNRYMRFAHDHNTTTFHTDFSEHLQATYEFKDVSTAERFYRWIAGVRMIPERWATGWGPNTFSDNYERYTIPAFKTWVSSNDDRSTVHNYYLLTVVEQGFTGLLMLLLLLGYAFYTAQRVYRRSADPFLRTIAAIGAVVLAIHCTVNFLNDLVETDKLGSLFYLAICTLIVADVKERSQEVKIQNSEFKKL